MADEPTPQLRPFRVRLDRFRRDQAFVVVTAPNDIDAKRIAVDLANKIYWSFVDSEVTASIDPIGASTPEGAAQ